MTDAIEIKATISAIKRQRNEALDREAILVGVVAARDERIAELELEAEVAKLRGTVAKDGSQPGELKNPVADAVLQDLRGSSPLNLRRSPERSDPHQAPTEEP